jgi:ribosomal protein L7/L12
MSFEEALIKRLDYIEEHLARIAAAVGQTYTPMKAAVGVGIPAEVVELVSSGKALHAIKLYRDLTGASLAEAKAVIDRLL